MAGCWLLIAVLALCPHASAQVPHLVRYQGQAVDSQGVPLEGPYDLTVRLYDAETGGTVTWQETHDDIPITGGHFSILLGSITPLDDMDWNEPCWLSIQLNDEAELSPRQRITSVPLALMAEQLDGPITTVGNNVGIGTATPSKTLSIGQQVPGENTDYGLEVLRHGTADNTGVYSPGAPVLFIEDLSGDGPMALDTVGLVDIGVPRIAPTDSNATNALLLKIHHDAGPIFAVNAAGNVGIGTTTPGNILTILPGSTTDPIADSWTVYSTSQSKTVLGPASPSGYLDQVAAIPLYQWRRAPLVSDEEAQAALGIANPTAEQLEAKKQELAQAKAQLPKFTAQRVGPLVDDATVPLEIVASNADGTKAGIDLLAYLGYLHAALKEAALKIELVEELRAELQALQQRVETLELR